MSIRPWRRRAGTGPVDPGAFDAVIDADVALADRLRAADRDRLTALAVEFDRSVGWEAVGGLQLGVRERATISANAAVAVLGVGLGPYRDVRAIIVTPGAVRAAGARRGPVGGLVDDRPRAVIGQAAPATGPVALAWDAVIGQSRRPEAGRNVVIHELAHKIDTADGYSDGTPPLAGEALAAWTRLLDDEYHAAGSDPSDQVLAPYAWTNASEFFAVASEAFFCTPRSLAAAKPRLYRGLAGWYRQDPLGDWEW